MLYYSEPQVVLQEVPGELSLALSISGCPMRCEGCHSAPTRNPKHGTPLTSLELERLLNENKHISCVLFYGGEWQPKELQDLFEYIKKSYDLKICLYTGRKLEDVPKNLMPLLDFLKVGEYIEKLGGLESPNTNQRFYKLTEGGFVEHKFF